MIGRPRFAGVLAITLLGGLLTLRPAIAAAADPALAELRARGAADTAAVAASAVDALGAVIDSAIAGARRGSALIIAGTDPPEVPLRTAAGALEAGSGTMADAAGALSVLAGTLAAVRPGEDAPRLEVTSTDLLGIASQLRASADAAEPFVARRQAAEATLASLATALVALTDDRPAEATTAIATARAARTNVASWEGAPPELAVWLNTTGSMLAAAQQIADALEADDPDAAAAAGEVYRAAAQQAAAADRALALSIAEQGSAIAGTPLQRLARASQAVKDARAMIASIAEALSQI